MVVVGVWKNVKLAEAVAPLLGSVCVDGYEKRRVRWMRPVVKMASARSMYWV